MTPMRVVIATENASLRMSGEAALALYYFDRLRKRNVDVWMVCHERVREELREMFPLDEDFQKIRFVEDSWLQKTISQWGRFAPFRIRDRILGQLIHLITQIRMRSVVKQLIEEFDIQLVFEPSPIAPKAVSCMYDMGVPVVIGPLCGGMEFPPAFQYLEPLTDRISTNIGRVLSEILHRILPGKLQADVLLVANERTAKALPKGSKGKVYEVVESGVDLTIWEPTDRPEPDPSRPTRFVYMARFVDQKGIPFLVEAFKQVAEQTNSVLELIGSGELLDATQAQVAALNIQDKVNFHGWMSLDAAAELISDCDVYMVPALRDCGGCAMLEAMAIGMPVIAANWAGPGEYADETCGFVVDPTTKEDFINGLAIAMIRMAQSPELRKQLSEGSIQRVKTKYFDWDSKTDRVIEIFEETLAQGKESRGVPEAALIS